VERKRSRARLRTKAAIANHPANSRRRHDEAITHRVYDRISERSRPQWQALGLTVSGVPTILESTNDLQTPDIDTGRLIQSLTCETSRSWQLAANTLSRHEMDRRRSVASKIGTHGRCYRRPPDGTATRNERMGAESRDR
jgi:hypothetical protein